MDWDYLTSGPGDRRMGRYAVVAFLPDHLEATIAPLREKYDPIHSVIGSHITVVFPFESARPMDELAGLIKAETDRWNPIDLGLSSIDDFYPKVPVIFWRVEIAPGLIDLYRGLYSRLDMEIPYHNYVPHVTLAREISHHRVLPVKEAIVSYLPQERFEVRAIDLVAPLNEQKWVSVRRFPLNGPLLSPDGL